MAEATAAREAIFHLPQFILEGDALKIIHNLRSTEDAFSAIGSLIDDIRIALSDHISMNVNWVPRDANKATHELVFRAKSCNYAKSLWNSPIILLDDFQQF